jgi:hypothetical protein
MVLPAVFFYTPARAGFFTAFRMTRIETGLTYPCGKDCTDCDIKLKQD